MEEFDLLKFQRLGEQLTPQKLVSLGLPSSLTPAGLVTTLLTKLVPSIGKSLLKRVFGRLVGQTSESSGFFSKLGKTIIRVIDAILGAIIGVIGGALVGAGAIGFAGISGGLSGIANEPTTISVNNRDSDNFVIHGDKAHQRYSSHGIWSESLSEPQNHSHHDYPKITPSQIELDFLK